MISKESLWTAAAAMSLLLMLAGCAQKPEAEPVQNLLQERDLLPTAEAISVVSGLTAVERGGISGLRLSSLCAPLARVSVDAQNAVRKSIDRRVGAVDIFLYSENTDINRDDRPYVASHIGVYEALNTRSDPVSIKIGDIYGFTSAAMSYGCPEYLTSLEDGAAGPGIGGVSTARVKGLADGAVGYSETSFRAPGSLPYEYIDEFGPVSSTVMSAYTEVDNRYFVIVSYYGQNYDVTGMDIGALLQLTVDRVREFNDGADS